MDVHSEKSGGLSPEAVEQCIRTLESILEDRVQLATIPEDMRHALIMAAGRVSRPDKLEIMKLSKLHRRQKKKKHDAADRKAVAETAIRAARRAEVFQNPVALPPSMGARPKLNRPRNCYVCKKEYDTLHFFYDSMCAECGDLNFAKRSQTASLEGTIALLTGGRIKIGYQCALMLLRAGARVIVTTRFPRDAVQRFAKEADYGNWKDRLELHGLDLRHSPSVDAFCEYLIERLPRLDFLINNAAQTVRRPPGFYRHLLDLEAAPLTTLPPVWRKPLEAYESFKTPRLHTGIESDWVADLSTKGAAIGIQAAGLLTQIPLLKGDSDPDHEHFPEGKRDADLQQIDLRTMNSWRMKLADVPTPELIEVQLVNSIAPFILCSKLKSVMLKNKYPYKHVVNVSAMEGKFTRYTKTDRHPHTNMAKAALNMMTLTSAPDYAKDGIYMNAVDTGWVTDEDPAQHSERKQLEHDFQPPLDIVDGAARVCDPIFSHVLSGEGVWGKFLKDFAPTSW
ncbi:MAG: SDR family oxidoreductase [Bdellovibrionales bacterium]|nr:SDR family oxidoreductase [Bdellovibrionales bacterium]